MNNFHVFLFWFYFLWSFVSFTAFLCFSAVVSRLPYIPPDRRPRERTGQLWGPNQVAPCRLAPAAPPSTAPILNTIPMHAAERPGPPAAVRYQQRRGDERAGPAWRLIGFLPGVVATAARRGRPLRLAPPGHTALTALAIGGRDSEVDVLLRVDAHEEGRDVHQLLADPVVGVWVDGVWRGRKLVSVIPPLPGLAYAWT